MKAAQRTPLILAPLLLAATAAPAAVTVNVQHQYSISSGPLVDVPASVELLQQICQGFDFEAITIASSQPGTSNSGFNFGVQTTQGSGNSSGITVNGQPADVSVAVEPCDLSLVTTLAWMGGEASAYVFHIGGGGPVQHKFSGSFTFSDRTVFEVSAPMTVELPVRISGGIVAGESFGDPFETYAKGTLSVTGPFGLSESVSIESVSVIPEQGNIDRSTTVAFNLPAGRTEMEWTITGSFSGEASAKSTGLFGSLSGAATVGISFPGSIEIRNFTGEGGAVLPADVNIYSADSGLIYAGVPEPAAGAALAGVALGAFAVWRRRRTGR